MARRPEHVEMVREECRRAGATFACEHSGKHLTVTVGLNGLTRKTTMSFTPSDRRAILNIRSIIRRYLAEMRSKA